MKTDRLEFLHGVMIGMDRAIAVARAHKGDIVSVMASADRAARDFEREHRRLNRNKSKK
jgi:hypothetical protein